MDSPFRCVHNVLIVVRIDQHDHYHIRMLCGGNRFPVKLQQRLPEPDTVALFNLGSKTLSIHIHRIYAYMNQ